MTKTIILRINEINNLIIYLTIVFLLIINPKLFAENYFTQIAKADTALTAKQWNQAIIILTDIINTGTTNNATVHLKLGYAYLQNKQLDKALIHYNKSNAISPTLDAQLGTQLIYLEKGDFPQCIQTGNQTIKKYGNNYFAAIRIAYCQYLNKKYWTSYDKYLSVADQFNNDMDALLGAWYSAHALNETNKARIIYERAHRFHPQDARLNKMKNAPPINTNRNNDLREKYMYYYLIPFFDYYSFSGTTDKEKSMDYGMLFSFYQKDGFHVSLGYKRNESTGKTNQDNFTTQAYKAGIGFRINQTYIDFNGHYIQSNDTYSDKAYSILGRIDRYSFVKIGVEGGFNHFPDYNQFQVGGTIGFNIFSHLNLYIDGIGQMLYYSTTELDRRNRPVQVYTYKYYHAFLPRISWDRAMYSFGFTYRKGSLYTPVLNNGNTLIYNTENLQDGYLFYIRFAPIREVSIGVHYGSDDWQDKDKKSFANSSIGGYLNIQF